MNLGKFLIENKQRPGHYWNSRTDKFVSELGGDYTLYATEARARKAAERISALYDVAIVTAPWRR